MRLAALPADLRVVDTGTAKASEIGEYPAPYPPPLARGGGWATRDGGN